MATSIREQIVSHWLTTLQGISKANLYENDLDSVERWKLPHNDQEGEKILIVKQGDEDQGDGDLQLDARILQIHTVIRVRQQVSDDQLSVDTVLNSIEQDIFKAARVDLTRGGLAYETRWLGSGEADADESGARGEKVITYEVRYYVNPFDESLQA